METGIRQAGSTTADSPCNLPIQTQKSRLYHSTVQRTAAVVWCNVFITSSSPFNTHVSVCVCVCVCVCCIDKIAHNRTIQPCGAYQVKILASYHWGMCVCVHVRSSLTGIYREGIVANPVCEKLRFSPVPIQAEYVAYSRDPPLPPAFRAIDYDGTAIIYTVNRHHRGLVPSLSDHASAYRWRSLPEIRQ